MSLEAIDYNALRLVWDIIITITLAVVAVYQWILNKDRAVQGQAQKEINDARQRIDVLREKVRDMEADIRHMPGHAELSVIHDRINSSNQILSGLGQKLDATNNLLNVLHNHLLEKGQV